MRIHGFTMLELLVTLAVATILITIAIPSFMHMIATNQRQTIVTDVIRAMNYARSEAITRNVAISVCADANAINCNNPTSTAWQNGWIIYSESAGKILHKHGTLPGNFTLTINGFKDKTITYLPNGRAKQTGSFTLCPSGQADIEGARIELSFAGQPYAKDYANCGGG